MGLKYQLDTLDGLDDSVKSLYTEKEGKFVLGIEGLPQPEEESGLKAKVDELLGEKKLAEKKAREAEELAILSVKKPLASPETSKSSKSHGPRSTSAAKLS